MPSDALGSPGTFSAAELNFSKELCPVPFNEEWYLKPKIWGLSVHVNVEVLLFPDLSVGGARKYYFFLKQILDLL